MTASMTTSPLKESRLPWVLYRYGDDLEMQAFYRMDDGETEVRSFPELHGKRVKIGGSSHGWIVVFREIENQYLLFNPLTRQSVSLPPLELEDVSEKYKYYSWLLTAPPAAGCDQDSFFLLFNRESLTSILSCKVGDQCWRRQLLDEEILEKALVGGCSAGQPVSCNGKIYAAVHGKKLLVIERVVPELSAHILEIGGAAGTLEPCTCCEGCMVESCGELFLVHRAIGGTKFNEVVGVEVFRLDLSNKEWIKVKSIEGRAIIDTCFSYPASATGREIGANCIYVLHKILYSFNLETNSLSEVHLPLPNLPMPGRSKGTWLAPDLRSLQMSRQSTKGPEELGIQMKSRSEEANTAGSMTMRLPREMLFEISRRLQLRDCLNFRAVNRLFRSVAPSLPLRDYLMEQRCSLPDPWLMSCRKEMGACLLIDPWGRERDKYFMSLPTPDYVMCYSKDNWCVMLEGTQSIFLWNPFKNSRIELPDCPHEWRSIAACGFSHSPLSPDFLLVLICVCVHPDHYLQVYIDILDGDEWSSDLAFSWHSEFEPPYHSALALYRGDFYCLDNHQGRLLVIRPGEEHISWEVLENPMLTLPPHHKRSYLLECDGNLLAVLTTVSGHDIQVFKLDFTEMSWVELQDLDNFVLYVSHFSSFSRPVTAPEMGNVIYFPRFLDNKLVPYSLRSKRFHYLGGEQAHISKVRSNGFQVGIEEQMLCAWIDPKWF